MSTKVICNDYEISVKQGFFKKPALIINLEKRSLSGEYPFTLTEEQMKEFCLSKISDAEKILRRTKDWKFNNPFKFEDGEVEYILGEYYQLHITTDPNLEQNVEMDEKNHSIKLTIHSIKEVNNFLEDYFQNLLEEYIASIIPEIEKDLEVKSKGFDIGEIEEGYGYCTDEAFIRFNSILYRKSKEAIKTVVLHELCHIKEFNHKEGFFNLMSSVVPNWKKTIIELKKAFPEIRIE